MQALFPASKSTRGARDMAGHPGEKITEGLDGLRDRLAEYSQMGARFAKWRAVIAVGEDIPSRGCIEANAQALARYAALCQEAGLVPVVEPEVLMDGGHSLERCREVTEEVLRTVFNQLYTQGVMLEGMLLKPNMVLPGLACPNRPRWTRWLTQRWSVSYEPSRQPFRGSRSYRAGNPRNWLRPV